MSRFEKRLWIIGLVLFSCSFIAAAGVSLRGGHSIYEFPMVQLNNLRRSLRPEREARKIERVSSLNGVTTIHIATTATRVSVLRNEANQDASIILEGRFSRTNQTPLQLNKSVETSSLTINVDEGITHVPWATAFGDGDHNAELAIVLPRLYSGNLEIETVSGDVRLAGLSLSELSWKSVSGALENRGGEIHIARLQSVNGDLDYDGESQEFDVNLTSANARVTLHGLEHLTSPKIDMQSVSGQMDLSISHQGSIRISMSSFTGQILTSVNLKKSMHSGGALEGQLGAGAGELRMRSVSGKIQLSTF